MSNSSYSKPDISTYSDIIDVDSIISSKSTRSSRFNKSTSIVNTVKTNSWVYNSHNINITYTPNNSIYFIIVSNSTFVNYECVIRDGDLVSPLDLEKFYSLITNCFNSQPTYSIDWEFEPNLLNITFSALLDGFFDISQSIRLNEKVLSNDKLLTIKLTEMESRHQEEINVLKTKLYELENTPIIFAHDPSSFGKFFSYPPNTEIFDFTKTSGYVWHGNYLDFNKLVKLKKIIMLDSNFEYKRNVADIFYSDSNCYYTNFNYKNYLNHLQNIFSSSQIYLPSVEELEVIYTINSPIPNMLYSLPNLSKIIFNNFANNSLFSFELIKAVPKLKHLEYNNCFNIQNLEQIKNWCDSKNIKLEIK